MNEFAANIILYNPDINRLQSNIEMIKDQVGIVYCYNNCSNNTDEIEALVAGFSNVRLINKEQNNGIAIAINEIAKIAIHSKFTWLLTLDQDSVCPGNMIETFKDFINEPNVGIICPFVIDRRRPKVTIPQDNYSYVDFCITSGSFMNLSIFERLGGLDDKLFVGQIDDEYCYRLIINGYKILQINNIILDHELGKLKPSKYAVYFLRMGEKFHSSTLRALSYKRVVLPIRVYFATRNIVYLSHKYKNNPTYKFSIKFAIKNGLSNIIRSQNKISVTKEFIRGLIEGRRMNKRV